MTAGLRIGNWNVEFARAGTDRGRAVTARLESWACDVLVVTEGSEAILPAGGHVVSSEEDYGYPIKEGRRKVLLWSRHPWSEVDVHVDDGLPSGRIAVGVTDTPIGPVRVVGVCIPWRDAHVRTGTKKRKVWEDHHLYLDALGPFLAGLPDDPPVVVAGDCNQRIPRRGQPIAVAEHLAQVFAPFTIVTAEHAPAGRDLIDHVALRGDLRAASVAPVPREFPAGRDMSDHDGVVVSLERIGGCPG